MGFESLYIGATGIKSHGTRMQNIGNNIANVNTLGFKNTNVHFENLISEVVPSGTDPTTGYAQSGKGVGLGAILTDYRSGAFMEGDTTTDLAISGKGFFRVVQDDVVRYTRAGNFRFDNEGYLVDPNGFRVQGQAYSDGVAGGTGDIQLPLDENGEVTTAPTATTSVTMGMNLGDIQDNTASGTNPFFSMFENWNGSTADGVPLTQGNYGYQNTIKVYDADGNDYDLNAYFDQVNVSNAGGKSYFEFVVGTDPSVDGRTGITGTSGAGAAMIGTMVFNAAGDLENVAAFTYDGDGDVKDLDNWTPAAFAEDGGAQIDMTFNGTSSGAGGTGSTFGVNFGLTSSSWATTVSNAGNVGHTASALPTMASPEAVAFSSTHYTGTSSTVFQSQDGSAEGYLMSLNVNAQGVLVGNFSNGAHEELAQFTLYNFTNEWGLRREGANHFSETQASGEALEGTPDTQNFGAVAQNSLEQSNVDMAEEFTKMIVTERGFQANSKVITTTDQILQILYQMKR